MRSASTAATCVILLKPVRVLLGHARVMSKSSIRGPVTMIVVSQETSQPGPGEPNPPWWNGRPCTKEDLYAFR